MEPADPLDPLAQAGLLGRLGLGQLGPQDPVVLPVAPDQMGLRALKGMPEFQGHLDPPGRLVLLEAAQLDQLE